MFWYPEKPKRIYNIDIVPASYIMQVKKDGWRILIDATGKDFKLYNRHGQVITCTNAREWKWLENVFGTGFYLDGEVIGRRQGEIIDTIVVWDMLYQKDFPLNNLNYIDRYNLLKEFTNEHIQFLREDSKVYGTTLIADNNGYQILLSKNYNITDFQEVWKKLEADNKYNEGVVFKNPNVPLKWSLSSTEKSVNQLKMKIRE